MNIYLKCALSKAKVLCFPAKYPFTKIFVLKVLMIGINCFRKATNPGNQGTC